MTRANQTAIRTKNSSSNRNASLSESFLRFRQRNRKHGNVISLRHTLHYIGITPRPPLQELGGAPRFAIFETWDSTAFSDN
jgi:hypothetical protein